MEYIREKHYSVALIRIKELENKLDKSLDCLKDCDRFIVADSNSANCMKFAISNVIAEVEEERHVMKVNS